MASLIALHSQAEVIRWLLIKLGLGTDPELSQAWPIGKGSEFDQPDNTITVYNTTGQIDGREMIEGEVFEHYGYQIRVRATRERLVAAKMATIVRTLESVANEIVTIDANSDVGAASYIVCAVNRRGSVIDMGKEYPTSERNVFTLNAVSAIYRTA